MQLLLIALILGVFIHDAAPAPETGAGLAALLARWLLPKVALAVAYWAACRRTLGRLGGRGAHRSLRRQEQLTTAFRLGTVLLYAADLYQGTLSDLRAMLGTGFLLDEAALLLPTLLLVVFGLWAYYPIDRRLREASLISLIDSGRPVYPIPTRLAFVLSLVRHEMALVLVPLVLLLGWAELAPRLVDDSWAPGGLHVESAVMMTGAIAIFLFSPLVIRLIWDTTPLPEGEIRGRLMAMCRTHRVGVRNVLLWNTGGSMINAAVMGIIAPLRYILLSDALLDQMHRPHVEAVMAHELAHVRRHHMFWLLAVAVSLLGLAVLGSDTFTLAAERLAERWGAGPLGTGLHRGVQVGSMIAAVAAWSVGFGWVSRRVERQADAFAVQHVASLRDEAETIDARSVDTVVTALQRVADLNHLSTRRNNWRHGSIAFRQAYLRTLVGQPVSRLDIDRVIGRIKLATVAAGLAVVAGYGLLPMS